MMENRLDLLTHEQIDWCDEHCDFKWFVKDDGKVYSKDDYICLKNKGSIESFLVNFGDCENFDCSYCHSLKSPEGASENVSGYFTCSDCHSLESLKGAPKKIGKYFDCNWCTSLKSLEEAPKSVGENFSCYGCESLKSLEGVPESISGNFDCSYSDSFESLKGAPESVSGNFNCSSCKSLKSLEGAPKNVGGYFDCGYCDLLEFIDGLKNTKIKGKIYYEYCPKLKKYEFILGDISVFKMWQRSDMIVDEFMKEYDGFLQAQKYGI